MTLHASTDRASAGASGNPEVPAPLALDAPLPDALGLPWWRQLTGYHWFVFLVASAAWFFDCLDQRIFSLARNPALNALKTAGTLDKEVQDFGKVVTAF